MFRWQWRGYLERQQTDIENTMDNQHSLELLHFACGLFLLETRDSGNYIPTPQHNNPHHGERIQMAFYHKTRRCITKRSYDWQEFPRHMRKEEYRKLHGGKPSRDQNAGLTWSEIKDIAQHQVL